ncbi:Wzz/FepE/Etk N-terminal domain-containing protein [Leadbetterella byssophila]|uniref:Wzz/FepE/Etk N-terminal domain-containing protein n=1 Tax=Leadbetterella byssophila TaxID=316068 RepID=UPI0039A2B50E
MEEEIRIDFGSLLSIIWKEKWKVVLIASVVTVLGLSYALLAREEFETQGKILPEIQGKGGGALGQFAGLASLAGVDLNSLGNSSIDAVRPDLYPDVIMSTPFYLELFKAQVRNKENRAMTFEEYYHLLLEDNEEPEEEKLYKYPVDDSNKKIILINELNEIRLKSLRKRINATIDKKTGIITINCKMPDPVVSADVTSFAMEYLMEYVRNYRTEKLRQDVDYLEEQVKTSRGRYYSTQEKKAKYTDQFQDIRLQSADVQRERIESEYKLSSSFYNELLKKYEEAKFKLHQETPVFKILEPPVAPAKKTEPRRTVIVLLSCFLGGLLGIAFILIWNNNYNHILKRIG